MKKWRKIYKHETMTQTVFINDDSETLLALEIKYFLCSVDSNKGFPMQYLKTILNTVQKEAS